MDPVLEKKVSKKTNVCRRPTEKKLSNLYAILKPKEGDDLTLAVKYKKCEKEKLSLIKWVNEKCVRTFKEYILAHPEITDVITYGFDSNLINLAEHCAYTSQRIGDQSEVRKVSYRSPSGPMINLDLSECRQTDLLVPPFRRVNVVVFLGVQEKQQSFNHILEYVQSRGLKVPKTDPREMTLNSDHALLEKASVRR